MYNAISMVQEDYEACFCIAVSTYANYVVVLKTSYFVRVIIIATDKDRLVEVHLIKNDGRDT